MFDDLASLMAGQARPGNDPRAWVSIGLVDADTPNARSVAFADDDGTPLPYPLVNVTLVPGGTRLPCRVASHFAGKGEGSWAPFQEGDEVIVVIPGGSEMEGGVIVGRLTQGRDSFPQNVGGTDPTKNTTAFFRSMASVIFETGNAFLFRETTAGAFLNIGNTGDITLQSGDGHYMSLSHDMVGLQLHDLSALVQLDPTSKQVLLQSQAAQLVLDQSASTFLSTGTLSLATSGNQPNWHATSIESVLMVLTAFNQMLVEVLTPVVTPMTGSTLAGLITPLITPIGLAAIVETAAALPYDPTILGSAVSSALQAGSTPGTPNVGCVGLLVG